MGIDRHGDDEYEDKADRTSGVNSRFKEFDCPSCNANNPYEEPFGDGDEIRCFYCGDEFQVRVTGAGRFRLREV